MIQPLEKLPEEPRRKLEKGRQPDWVAPMLAKLTHDHFSDPDWVFERKLDGERCLAFVRSGEVTLKSRNKKLINISYPEIVESLAGTVGCDCILDGEIVAFEDGISSFARLQNRMHVQDPGQARRGPAVYYYLFDIVHCGGYDLSSVALRHRKNVLREAVEFKDPVRFLNHRNEHGEKYLGEACEKGWEGIIAKDAASRYVHSRSSKWLKFKCVREQEFVIGGYTEPRGSRHGFGALLIGYYGKGGLQYAGKVGTGYDDQTLTDLGEKLADLETKKNPLPEEPGGSGVHFVEPRLVAQIGFTEWTDDGKLRHPRFLGLRRDKDPRDVTRES
jgi:DNA ligase D-like protein (predicted ligase)